jgi:hypothetical protein
MDGGEWGGEKKNFGWKEEKQNNTTHIKKEIMKNKKKGIK